MNIGAGELAFLLVLVPLVPVGFLWGLNLPPQPPVR